MPELPEFGHETGDRIEALEADIRERDNEIQRLRLRLSEADTLVAEMRELVEDEQAVREQWIEAFNVVRVEGGWRYPDDELRNDYNELVDRFNTLLRDYKRFARQYDAVVSPRFVGRPLDASADQIARVRKLRKDGLSLSEIEEQTNLSRRTVRTILEKDRGTDRTSKRTNELRVRELNRIRVAEWRARQRQIEGVLSKIPALRKRGDMLIKAANGLGKLE